MKTQKLVQEIHDAFDVASEVALKEAQTSIESLSSQEAPHELEDIGQRMAKIGFGNTHVAKQVRGHQEEQKKIQERKAAKIKEAKMIVDKGLLDPAHRFITEGKVEELCKKYNLIHGPADKYIGDMPVKNLEAIEAFRASEEENEFIIELNFNRYDRDSQDCQLFESLAKEPSVESKKVRTFGGYKYIKVGYVMPETMVRKYDVFHRVVRSSDFSICAPAKDFDKEGMEVKKRRLMQKPAPDPVVLYKVTGGYRIVTAWGPEAKDKNVLNPNHN